VLSAPARVITKIGVKAPLGFGASSLGAGTSGRASYPLGGHRGRPLDMSWADSGRRPPGLIMKHHDVQFGARLLSTKAAYAAGSRRDLTPK
jgi:hypothetical protein